MRILKVKKYTGFLNKFMEEKSKKLIYLEKILRMMAIATLKVHKPKIVGITGSVGKTSAKEAIFGVLKDSFKTRKNEENYNNEIGVPLTIIGAKTGGNNPLKWIWVVIKWIFGIIIPFGYPKVLVLEMAIDRPGDMKYLTSFIHSDVGVLTDISSSHLEFFKGVGAIAKEKSILIKKLSENGLAVLNFDNEIIKKMKDKIKARIVDFGMESERKISATDIKFVYNERDKKIRGLSFKLNHEGKIVPIRLPHIIAKHHVYAVLAAAAVGNYFKINLLDIAKSLESLEPPHGRMTPVEGTKNSLIIDDTYNSSPVSAGAALDTVERMRAVRRIAILGDMMELGEASDEGHIQVIRNALNRNFDVIVLVGKRMKKAAESIAVKEISNKKIIYFANPNEAGFRIKEFVREGDLVLVKGSQAMRMEKVVEKIMKEPENAGKILCRQSRTWKSKDFLQA